MAPKNDQDTTGEKVTASTYGALDKGKVDNKLWMLKVSSKELAKVWNEAPEGSVVGELVFTKGGKINGGKDSVKPSLEVNVSEEIANTSSEPVPLKYHLEALTSRVPVIYPFSRNPNGSVKMLGTVSRTANLQMSRTDERYRNLCKNRILKTSITSSRFVRPVEANELSVRKSHSAALSSSKGFGSAVQQFGNRMAEANDGVEGDPSSKKRKYEGQTTQSVIFELFSAQPFWSVKEMRQSSGRPEKEIRQVLSQIADFHRSGEHKGTWQLRKEFQKQS